MDFFTLVESSFRGYRKNLSLIVPHLVENVLNFLFLILFVITIFLSLGVSLSSLYSLAPPNFNLSFSMVAILLFCILCMIFLFLIVDSCRRASTIYMAKEVFETGKTNLSAGFKGFKSFWFQIFLYLLILVVFFFAAIALPMIFAYSRNNFLAIFFLVFLLLSFSFFHFFTLFTPQEIVIRGCNTLDGIVESFRFVKSNFLNVVLYCLFVFLFYFAFAILSIFFINASEFLMALFNLIFIILNIAAPPYFEVLKTYMVSFSRLKTGACSRRN